MTKLIKDHKMKAGKTFLSPMTIVENNFMGVATNQLIYTETNAYEDG